MGYTTLPIWTSNYTVPTFECPTCGIKFERGNNENVLLEHTTYEVRHIPPIIEFTCFNSDCTDVDKSFEFELRYIVTAQLKNSS